MWGWRLKMVDKRSYFTPDMSSGGKVTDRCGWGLYSVEEFVFWSLLLGLTVARLIKVCFELDKFVECDCCFRSLAEGQGYNSTSGWALCFARGKDLFFIARSGLSLPWSGGRHYSACYFSHS